MEAKIAGMLVVAVVILTSGNKGGTAGLEEDPPFGQNIQISSLIFPESLDFAGEPVPLELYDVREALDRELLSNTYFHSQTIRLIKRANRYFPLIEKVLNANGVPEDFKYLALAESGLSQAVSPAQAVGFWQLLKGTARDYGLEVTAEVDERYHIEKSTVAACRYILDSYERYGNWTMAAASYNAGRRGIDRQVQRQKKENYYDLLLTEETARYIFRVLSFKLIFEAPETYGFHIPESELYPVIPVYEVQVDSSINHFADFAALYDCNYKIIKQLNPWLRDTGLINQKGKTYTLLIPESGYRRPDAWE